MDKWNLSGAQNIKNRAAVEAKGFLGLLVHFDPAGTKEVEDPYYGGMKGFHDIVRC